jgi:hypothetical protein
VAAQPNRPRRPHLQPGVKALSSFLDVAKTRTLPPTEIEAIWRMRHASNPRSLSTAFTAITIDFGCSTTREQICYASMETTDLFLYFLLS